MKTLKKSAAVIGIIVLIAAIIALPKVSVSAAIEGFTVWFLYVLPSLFPFFFLSGLLSGFDVIEKLCAKLSAFTQKTFGLSPIALYAGAMSYVSGYPIGAKITENLYREKLILPEETLTCALLSSTSGMVFIIDTTGGILLGNSLYGVIIYICHVFGAIVTAMIFKPKVKNRSFCNRVLYQKIDKTLFELMFDSVVSILCVGGYIALFYVLYKVLSTLKILLPFEKGLSFILSPIGKDLGKDVLSGIFECTQGIKKISANLKNKKAAAIIACGLLSFGGLSINMQNLSFLSKTNVKARNYLFGKVVHSALSTFLISLVFLFV